MIQHFFHERAQGEEEEKKLSQYCNKLKQLKLFFARWLAGWLAGLLLKACVYFIHSFIGRELLRE
jgi:hypothetical protein